MGEISFPPDPLPLTSYLFFAAFVPGYGGGSATAFHRIPFFVAPSHPSFFEYLTSSESCCQEIFWKFRPKLKYESGHSCIDTEDEIPPSLPLPKGGIPLFEKEGLGEILEKHVQSIMDSLVNAFFPQKKLDRNGTFII
jgi:hypothetical protein